MAESRPRGAVVGPFSGPRAAWGEHLERAAAVHGAVDWELYDDRGEAETARRIAEAVVAEGRHALVIGHFNSAGARAALPVYRAGGLPVLLPLATTPDLLTDSAGTVLRWCPDDRAQATSLLAAVRSAGHTRIAVTHDGTAYGEGLARLVREAWPGDAGARVAAAAGAGPGSDGGRAPGPTAGAGPGSDGGRAPGPTAGAGPGSGLAAGAVALPKGPVVSDGSGPATGAVPDGVVTGLVTGLAASLAGPRDAQADPAGSAGGDRVPVVSYGGGRPDVTAASSGVEGPVPVPAESALVVRGGPVGAVRASAPAPVPEIVDGPQDAADLTDLTGLSALVVCGTHGGAARVGREWRAGGFGGELYFTDDCAVEEFSELLGDASRAAKVARMRGGPEVHVTAAFAAATRALAEDPERTGRALLAAVRAHADRGFTALGEPVEGSVGWDISPVPPPPRAPSGGGGHQGRAYDVLVVGAGVVGAATAAALARQGARVALVAPMDGRRDHATAWSGGLVRAFEADPYLRGLALRSHQLAWGPAALVPGPYGFVPTGSLVLCGDADLDQAEKGVAELNGAGVPAELLAPGTLRERFPGLAVDGVTAAVWEPEGGYADPPRTARVYRDRALAHGAVLLPARVRELVAPPGADRVRVLLEPGGPVDALAVVLAAGSGTGAIAGHRLSGSDAGRTKSIRYGFFHHPDTAGLPTVVDMVTGVWGRPQVTGEAAGGYMAGRPVDEWDVPAGGEDTLTDEHVAYIREGASTRWPWLADPATRFLGGRQGVDLYTPHSLPHLGRERSGSRIVLATGWSGAGFKTAPAAAELAAAEALDALAGT
ncbi:FAD-dependent oxidoreductase [Streptomyces vilmorinianum]|uniref:FAD-dependent oxidoreductase n=1 Tax=Streptomyces vilmorinianum TaxID=3051092 RepID=UPI0010FBAB54|nr:FAD-dependent oxidoreductase [Streptomyces vilmorinianum]